MIHDEIRSRLVDARERKLSVTFNHLDASDILSELDAKTVSKQKTFFGKDFPQDLVIAVTPLSHQLFVRPREEGE